MASAMGADRVRVAVSALAPESGVSASEARLMSDLLRAELFETGEFQVMNREDMASVLKEIKFQQSGACDETSCLVEMGQALGVEKMVAGSIGLFEDSYVVTVKLIHVGRMENEKMASDSFARGKGGDPRFFLRKLAHKLADLEAPEAPSKTPPKSVWTATVKAAFPGGGQHYNGQHGKGYAVQGICAAGLVTLVGSALNEGRGQGAGIASGAVLLYGGYMFGMLDARSQAKKINERWASGQGTP